MTRPATGEPDDPPAAGTAAGSRASKQPTRRPVTEATSALGQQADDPDATGSEPGGQGREPQLGGAATARDAAQSRANRPVDDTATSVSRQQADDPDTTECGPGVGVAAVGSRWVAVVGLLVAAVAYSSWLVAGWLNPPLHSVESFASELAATDQPWSGLFRGADVLAGAAAVVAGVGLTRRWPWPVWASVVAFGCLTIVDSGLFPMTCAPSVDAGCAAAEAAGTVPPRHRIHTVTSSLATTAALAGTIVTAWLWRTTASRVLCGALIAATLVTLGAIAAERFVGFGQRLQLVLVSAWLLWLGLRLTVGNGRRS